MATSVTIPIRLVSEANQRGSWQGKFFKRTKPQREMTYLFCKAKLGKPPPPPLRITITRIAPRSLDPDNLVSSQKAVIDGIAQWLGVDDRDARLHWVAQQEKPSVKGQYAVRIDLEPARGEP